LRRQVTGSAFNLAAGRTMAIQNGGDAIFNGDYTTAANAIYNVSGAGSTLQTGNLLAIGNGAQVNVTSGGVINAVPLVGDGSVGTLLVDASTVSFGSGGLTNWGTNGGIATVTFSNGATGTLSGFGIFIGSGGTPGTTGLVNVQSGASLSVGGLFIGAVGGTTTSGTLNINGNGSVTQSGTNQLSVGSSAGTGVINIGTTTTGGTLNTGSGLFTISATGAVNVGAGANTGILNANGDILIDGGELTQSNGSIFTLDSGKTMTIGNGGTASFNNLRIDLDDHVNVISAGSVSSETVIEIAFASDGTLAVDGSGSSAMVTNSFATPSTWGLNGHTATVTFSSNSIGLFNSGINLVGNFDAGTTANVSVETGADLTAAGVMNVAAIGGGATAATLSVVGTGSTVTVSPGAFSPAALSIGHSSAGTGEVSVVDNAVLTVDTGGSTNLNATGTINIDGGTVDLKTLNDNGGTINFIAGSLSYIGNLTVGSGGLLGTNLTLASNHALTLSGTTTIDAGRTLTLDGGTLDTGSLVVNGAFHFDRGTLGINGGTISGLGNLTVGSNAELRARGVQTLAIVGVAGSTITATGSLTLGDATKVNGVYSNGTVQVGANTVTFADANDAVLDSAALVTLGVGGSPGTLSAANGLTLDFGGNATGFGTVNTPNSAAQPLTNNGHIAGNSGAQPITLTGYVKGVGTLDNVVITGTDAPGFSPATVVRGSVVYDGALEIEIGGTSSGSFDRIQHMLGAGLANLGGTLDVELINGFHPALDDAFEIITAAGGVSGMFETLAAQLPALTSGLEWTINYGANNVVLRVVAVGLLGDYNQNGFVDAADYTVWRNQLGSLASLPNDNTVGVGPDDYTRWKTHFGESSGLGSGAAATVAAPEPATLAMLLGGILGMCVRRRRLSQDGSFGRTIR
jgi:hypothetical protein